MLLWIILTAMTAGTAVWLSLPLLRQRDERSLAAAHELEVYRDQLAEVERELAEGAIEGDQAEAAGLEIKRRLLTAERGRGRASANLSLGEQHLALASVAAIVVLGSSILYSNFGRPDVPSVSREATSLVIGDRQQGATFRSASGRTVTGGGANQSAQGGAAGSNLGSVDDMIQRLADRVKKEPENFETWRMLGWSYFATERYPEAADAYRKAIALQPKNATLLTSLGETLVRAAAGEVKADAAAVFEAALALEPRDARARFFKGLQLEQAGKKQEALDAWIAVLADATADDAWGPSLRARIVELAGELKVDVTARLPTAPAAANTAPVATAPAGGVLQRLQSRAIEPADASSAATQKGPSSEAVAAAEAMTPADRQAMIRNMVDGLAVRLDKAPRDADGWIQLIRSRKVLGQEAEAKAALSKAIAVFADTPAEQGRITAAAKELAVTP